MKYHYTSPGWYETAETNQTCHCLSSRCRYSATIVSVSISKGFVQAKFICWRKQTPPPTPPLQERRRPRYPKTPSSSRANVCRQLPCRSSERMKNHDAHGKYDLSSYLQAAYFFSLAFSAIAAVALPPVRRPVRRAAMRPTWCEVQELSWRAERDKCARRWGRSRMCSEGTEKLMECAG